MKSILLCVAGGTPQIITETLYALTQVRKERVDEVRVITTPVGRDRVMKDLLESGKGKFFQFCKDYEIDPATIKFDETTIILLGADTGAVMDDLVTEEDNQAATDHICRIVRGLTKDSTTRIHASVGGGRKTMGIGLTVAMQLFGRSQDRLSHVLVAAEYESHQQFYYPRPRSEVLKDRDGNPITASPWVSVSDIAYIRLGGVLSGWLSDDAFSYNQLVERMQEELDVRSGKLRLHLAEECVLLANRSIPLPDRQFFVYVLLALWRFRTEGKGFLRLADLKREHLQEVLRLIAPARNPESFIDGEKITVERADGMKGYDFLERWLELIEGREVLKLDTHFAQIRSKVNRELRKHGLPEHFHIQKRGKKANAAYGLMAPPALLTLIKPRQG